MEKTQDEKVEFITKASHCDYNFLWKCNHKNQKGKKCTEICTLYHNSYEKEEVETIKN